MDVMSDPPLAKSGAQHSASCVMVILGPFPREFIHSLCRRRDSNPHYWPTFSPFLLNNRRWRPPTSSRSCAACRHHVAAARSRRAVAT
jgi:hypothetical protein